MVPLTTRPMTGETKLRRVISKTRTYDSALNQLEVCFVQGVRCSERGIPWNGWKCPRRNETENLEVGHCLGGVLRTHPCVGLLRPWHTLFRQSQLRQFMAGRHLSNGHPRGQRSHRKGRNHQLLRRSQQVTVNGLPLYTYSPDIKPGDDSGQGYSGIWWVVGPNSNKISAVTTPANNGY